MKINQKSTRLFVFVIAILALAVFPIPAAATHAWANYHWARTANPFTIKVVDSMTTDWDGNLDTALSDWDASTVMKIVKETGDSTFRARKRCVAIPGKVHACNATYGRNGWLGLAQIWVSGDHITQGIAKMNDTYLASTSYTEINRQHVICQEIGHDWGLDHQDESGADLNTCMDYSRLLDNPHPNAHDYQELGIIYAHLDSTTTVSPMPAGFANADVHAVENWGTKIRESEDGRTALYVLDFGDGFQVFTFVVWA